MGFGGQGLGIGVECKFLESSLPGGARGLGLFLGLTHCKLDSNSERAAPEK